MPERLGVIAKDAPSALPLLFEFIGGGGARVGRGRRLAGGHRFPFTCCTLDSKRPASGALVAQQPHGCSVSMETLSTPIDVGGPWRPNDQHPHGETLAVVARTSR